MAMYEHGYEGTIEFQLEAPLRDELIIRTAESLDRKQGNEFYFGENSIRMLYPSDRYKDEQSDEPKRLKRLMRNPFPRKNRERIFDLLLWIRENGKVVSAEITPFHMKTGERMDKIIGKNNEFFRSITIEEQAEGIQEERMESEEMKTP
jgi:hypothetical protein